MTLQDGQIEDDRVDWNTQKNLESLASEQTFSYQDMPNLDMNLLSMKSTIKFKISFCIFTVIFFTFVKKSLIKSKVLLNGNYNSQVQRYIEASETVMSPVIDLVGPLFTSKVWEDLRYEVI